MNPTPHASKAEAPNQNQPKEPTIAALENMSFSQLLYYALFYPTPTPSVT
jgi:hypothetical protein